MSSPETLNPVRYGVIGCGVIGPQHIQSAMELEHTTVVAVADKMKPRAEELAAKWNVPRVYDDAIALMEDPEVEAVVLALATGYRVGLAQEAIRRGKHVMLEKPAALNAGELAEIQKVARERPDVLVAGASARYMFMPHVETVRNFIASGALGDLRVIHFRGILPPGPQPTAPPPPWRLSRGQNGGGILVNWGIYELDYMFGLTNWTLKPRHVLANFWGIPPQFSHYADPASDADSHFASFITCEGGTVISFERGERVAAKGETIARIVGTKGSLTLSMFPENNKKIVFHNSASDKGVWDEVIWQGDEDWPSTRLGIIDDFARAIRDKRQPQTNLARAMVLQKITDAIYQSADERRPIEIE